MYYNRNVSRETFGESMVKGIIFDYNGTMYFDHEYNVESWKEVYRKITGSLEGFDELLRESYSINNGTLIKMFGQKVNKQLSESEIEELSLEKERTYQEFCLKNGENKLSPGTVEAIEYFLKNNYKINICTASIKYNVDFYFENTNLDKWFDRSLVAYDNKNCLGKVEMYIEAAKNINLDPKECLVFEDSKKGIEDAIKAGFNKIIHVNNYHIPSVDYPEVLCEIEDFAKLDYSLFDKNLL